MASVDTVHFDLFRFSESTIDKDGNWSKLNRTWSSFVQYMGDCWWGSVSEERIESFLIRPEVANGAIVIAETFHDTALPRVCSGMVKTDNTIITFNIILHQGSYSSTKFEHWRTGNLVERIQRLMKEVPGGYLLVRPGDIPDGPKRFSGARVVDEMRDMIQLLKGAWWGLTHGWYRYYKSFEHREQIQDLQRMKEGYHCISAAAICYMYQDSCGHLFEIIASDYGIYYVTFCDGGFKLELDHGKTKHFSTLRRLLDHMTTVEKVTFVRRPTPTLQQLCRRVIKVDQETIKFLPQPLRDFLWVDPWE